MRRNHYNFYIVYFAFFLANIMVNSSNENNQPSDNGQLGQILLSNFDPSSLDTTTPSAKLALYLIENGRAQEVHDNFDNYKNILSDEIIFKLIDALDSNIAKSNVANLDNIPLDVFSRYAKWCKGKVKSGIQQIEDNNQYVNYLQNAPKSWKQTFAIFSPEEQKRLSECIEFYPEMIAVKTSMKIEWEQKSVKIYLDKDYLSVDEKTAQQTDEVEIIDGNVYMTMQWAKSLVPENLQLKPSVFVAISNIFNTGESFKVAADMRSLKLVGELLGIERRGCILHKGDKKVNSRDESALCLTMGTWTNNGISTGNPIVLFVWESVWTLKQVYPDYMTLVRKLAKPIEVLS